MRINEYALMRAVFEMAFKSMINRLIDADLIRSYPDETAIAQAEDRCWNELCVAMSELGVEFESGDE